MDHDLKLCEHTYFTLPSTFSLKWSKEYKIREKGRPVLEIRIKCYQHLGAWIDICKIFYRQKKNSMDKIELWGELTSMWKKCLFF